MIVSCLERKGINPILIKGLDNFCTLELYGQKLKDLYENTVGIKPEDD